MSTRGTFPVRFFAAGFEGDVLDPLLDLEADDDEAAVGVVEGLLLGVLGVDFDDLLRLLVLVGVDTSTFTEGVDMVWSGTIPQ